LIWPFPPQRVVTRFNFGVHAFEASVRFLGHRWYFFRPERLRELRVGQFVRYFTFGGTDVHKWVPPAKRTDENTTLDSAAASDADTTHRHYHVMAQDVPEGKVFPNREYPSLSVHRRVNTRLSVPRSAFLEPLGEKRDKFYEQRLLESLPWYLSWPKLTRVFFYRACEKGLRGFEKALIFADSQVDTYLMESSR
jgi:hypothetical protein